MFDFKDGGRFIQDPIVSLSEIVKTLSLFASVLRFTDTFCTADKTVPHRQVSDVLPDLVNKFTGEGSHIGGAERLKKRALRHALDFGTGRIWLVLYFLHHVAQWV